MTVVVLDEDTWTARRAAHERRVDDAVAGHRLRARTGQRHPVEDFLFRYYSLRPGELRRWHPGLGTALAGPRSVEQLELKGYHQGVAGVAVSPECVADRSALVRTIHRLLRATAARPPQLGCFGLHEWAMVYRQDADEVRHRSWPLRLGGAGTDQVVETHRIACSHFDAYRFFTEPARPLNVLAPRHDNRSDLEQPGCLHAGMDLYKHAGRLLPLVSSELVMDCFDLAREIRVLDMRASPYDLSELGYPPVAIETVAGKQTYAAAQRSFAERARPLRHRLIEVCERVLDPLSIGADPAGHPSSGFVAPGGAGPATPGGVEPTR